MKKFNWDTEVTKPSMKDETIAILKTDHVNINTAVFKKILLDTSGEGSEKDPLKYNHVILGLNEENGKKTVALKLLKVKEKGSYRIRRTKSGATFSAKRSINKFGIKHKKSRSYPVTCNTLEDGSKVLTFTLDADDKKNSDQKINE